MDERRSTSFLSAAFATANGAIRCALLASAIATVFACNRPSEAECQRAIERIRTLAGTTDSTYGASPEAAVRSCRGNATRKAVQCILAARTLQDVAACEGRVYEAPVEQDQQEPESTSSAAAAESKAAATRHSP